MAENPQNSVVITKILCYDFYRNILGSAKVKLKGQHLWLKVHYHKINFYFLAFL